jgi:hypothetical protein
VHASRTAAIYAVAMILGFTFLVAGCDKEEPVKAYDAPKDPQLISWTLPDAWKPARFDRKLQHAGFAAGNEDDPVSITVSFLFTDAPSARDLVMNVNRWRKQLELTPLPPKDVPTAVKTIETAGSPLQVVDLVKEDNTRRTLAYIAPHADRVWFFKATGSPAAVEAVKPPFEAFVKSAKYLTPAATPLTVAAAENEPALEMPAGHPAVNAAPPAAAPQPVADKESPGFTYALPEGWSVKPNANSVRLLTASTGGEKPAELIVSRFPGNVGGTALNLNRWRREVGLPPTDDEKAHKETPVKVGTADGAMLEFVGPEGANQKKSLVAKRTVGDNTWFFKLLGPAETVTAQKQAFEQFLASVRFEEEKK